MSRATRFPTHHEIAGRRRRLGLTKFAKDLDDGKYAYSWYENAQDGSGEEASVDGDASGAGLTSHL
jgi:hypothetical protein